MAPKKTPTADDIMSSINADDQALEHAIDDLRGVLQKDAAGSLVGGLPETAAADPLSQFGGDFGSDFGMDTAAQSDFGASDFGGTDFGAGASFADAGGMDDFGAAMADPAEPPRPGSAMQSNLDLIMDIPIDLQIVLGSSQMQVSGLMNLTEGATIALDRRIGEPVEVMVNGRIIGRGEITVLENDDTRFGVKLIEVKNTRKV